MNKRSLINSVLLCFALSVFMASGGCTSSNNGNPQTTAAKLPELTDEKIRETINDARVRDVPEKDGTAKPMSWSFDYDEPKEFKSIEKQMDGNKATVVIDIATRSTPGARNPLELSGKIRLYYELERGLVLRQWQVVKAENISMTYRNLAEPSPSPPERVGN